MVLLNTGSFKGKKGYHKKFPGNLLQFHKDTWQFHTFIPPRITIFLFLNYK